MYDKIYKETHWNNGNVFSKGYTLGGIKVGYWQGFHENGNLKWFATFDKDGIIVGYSEDYTYNGDLCNKEFFL